MEKYTYNITGQMSHNDADTDNGFETVAIDEEIEIFEMSPATALSLFLENNERYEFYGHLETCDAKTHGKSGATYRDKNERQVVDINLV